MQNILIAAVILLAGIAGWQYLDKTYILADLKFARKTRTREFRRNRKLKQRIAELQDRLDFSEYETSCFKANADYLERQLIDMKENYEASKQLSTSLMHLNQELQEKLSRRKQPRKQNGEFTSKQTA